MNLSFARNVGPHGARVDQGEFVIISFGLDRKEGTRHRSL